MKKVRKARIFAICILLVSNNTFAQTLSNDLNEKSQTQEQETKKIVLNESGLSPLDEIETENSFDTIPSYDTEKSGENFSSEKILADEENVEIDFDNIDNLFEDSTDTDAIITETQEKKETETTKKGIVLTGNLYTKLGGYSYFYPFEMYPGAIFESTLSFSSRPKDTFSIYGSLLVNFPNMDLGLYELYINYSLWNFAYILAGKKEVVWGNARIFDTNILDDINNDKNEYNPEKLLTDKEINIDNSKFTVQLSVPVRMFNFVGLLNYKNYNNEKQLGRSSVRNISFAAMVEANIKNFSFDFFWRMWAKNDPQSFDPIIGVNANFQFGDFHFYGQYFMHMNNDKEQIAFPRTKTTASVWWATREKINLGFVLEYQLVYDDHGYGKDYSPNPSEYYKNYLAFEGVWGKINGSQFTVALKYFHDFYEGYGTILPGIKIHNILPDASLDVGFPIYYGTQQKYGIALQLTLNVNF